MTLRVCCALVLTLGAPLAHAGDVDDAVDRGCVWLCGQMRKDGGFGAPDEAYRFGKTALAALTLAHCDRKEDARIRRAVLAFLKENYESLLKSDSMAEMPTYSLSLMMLTLHRTYVAGRKRGRLPAWGRRATKVCAKWLIDNRPRDALFGYPAPSVGRAARGDMSNTQYALLGLWAAARCGYPPPAERVIEVAEVLTRAQQADGEEAWLPPAHEGTAERQKGQARGFGYIGVEPPTPSMTAGGLSSLLVTKALLQESDHIPGELGQKLDRGIRDALLWLTVHRDESPMLPVRGGDYYYLYGLERACVLAGVTKLGERDWYEEGVATLLERQREDGSWESKAAMPGERSAVVDTCFALLFLKRACIQPERPLYRPRATTQDK